MEVVALAGLLGLGYAVTKLATPSGVDDTPISYKKGNASLREAFESAAPTGPPGTPLTTMAKGGSAKGASQELDMMYATPGGTVYPSEINPGPQGTALRYASKTSKQDYGSSPALRAGESATSQVMMNAGGIEDNPVYVDGKFVVSPLSGNKIATNEFTHNNMVPFFGSNIIDVWIAFHDGHNFIFFRCN